MKIDDKITSIDEQPVNQELARRALPVLVGVLCQPDAFTAVADELGKWLALPKRGIDYRANAFTRTLWAAIAELHKSGRPLHPVTVMQQAEAIASRRVKGLLAAWTPEHAEHFADARRQYALDMLSPSVVVDLARDWSREAVKMCELAPAAAQLSKAMTEGSPVDIADELARMQSAASRCSAAVNVPEGNIVELFGEWLTDTRATKLPTGFKEIDSRYGGLDIGYPVAIARRRGDGKTPMLQALTLGMVCRLSTSYEHRACPSARAEVTTADDRPFVLMLSCEMTRGDILSRMAASLLLIDQGELSRDKQDAINNRGSEYAKLLADLEQHGRLVLLDEELLKGSSPQLVCAALESWASNIRTKHGPDATLFAALDYLQYLVDPDADEKDTKRYEELQATMRRIKDITAKYRIATVVGLQCGGDSPLPAAPQPGAPSPRQSKASQSKTSLGDISASKGTLNDCSAVWLIWRSTDPQQETTFQLHAGKGRFGPKHWTADLHFEGRYMVLTDPDPAATSPDTTILSNPADYDECPI